MKDNINPLTDKLYKVLEQPQDFFEFWEKYVYAEDKRSGSMPRTSKGLIIGIRVDAVLLRINNNMTSWLPLNHDKVEFYIDPNEH